MRTPGSGGEGGSGSGSGSIGSFSSSSSSSDPEGEDKEGEDDEDKEGEDDEEGEAEGKENAESLSMSSIDTGDAGITDREKEHAIQSERYESTSSTRAINRHANHSTSPCHFTVDLPRGDGGGDGGTINMSASGGPEDSTRYYTKVTRQMISLVDTIVIPFLS